MQAEIRPYHGEARTWFQTWKAESAIFRSLWPDAPARLFMSRTRLFPVKVMGIIRWECIPVPDSLQAGSEASSFAFFLMLPASSPKTLKASF